MTRVAILLLAVFFAIATCILVAVSVSLAAPGTPFDAIWGLRPDRRVLLAEHRNLIVPAFITLAVPMMLASYGCFRRRAWGRRLAIAIFTANGIGDLIEGARGGYLEAAIGITATTLLVVFLTRPSMRAAFSG